MITDPIVERLHKQREEYMERFQFDFDAVIRDIRSREASNPSPLLEPPAAPPPQEAMQRPRGEPPILRVIGTVTWREGPYAGIAFGPDTAGDAALIHQVVRKFLRRK